MDNKPNYYINAVNALSYPISDDLNAAEKGLYITIVLKFNRFGWKKKIVGIKNIELIATTGISEKTLDKYRQNLVDIGLLEVKKGARGRVTEYKLPYSEINNITFSSSDSSSDSSQYNKKESKQENNRLDSSLKSSNKIIDCNNNPVDSSQNSSTHKIKDKRYLYNKNNNKDFSKNNFEEENFSENENFEKPIEEKISKPPKAEFSPSKKVAPKKVSQKTQESQVDELELPFESEEFRMIWNEFRTYRKVEQTNAVTLTSAKRMFKKLAKYDEKTAIEAFDLSMEKGWTGVFPENITRQQTFQANKTTQNTKPDFVNADYSNTSL